MSTIKYLNAWGAEITLENVTLLSVTLPGREEEKTTRGHLRELTRVPQELGGYEELKALRPDAPFTLPDDARERIARVIDPSKWSVLDYYLAQMLRKYEGEKIGYDPEQFKDKDSLSKADQIIAIITGGE